MWSGCIAGALLDSDYEAKLGAAGFKDIGIEPTRIYDQQAVEEMAAGAVASGAEVDVAETVEALDGAVMSAFVRATKPRVS